MQVKYKQFGYFIIFLYQYFESIIEHAHLNCTIKCRLPASPYNIHILTGFCLRIFIVILYHLFNAANIHLFTLNKYLFNELLKLVLYWNMIPRYLCPLAHSSDTPSKSEIGYFLTFSMENITIFEFRGLHLSSFFL